MSFWFDCDSTMVLRHCGESTLSPLPHSLPFTIKKDNKLSTALDTTGSTWCHNLDHAHWVEFDLGAPHYITSMRGLLTAFTNIQDVTFYVANDDEEYGDPVLVISDYQNLTPQDSYVYENTIAKLGRYVMMIIPYTTDPDNYLTWGSV